MIFPALRKAYSRQIGDGQELDGGAAVGLQDENGGTGEIGCVTLENDGITLRRPRRKVIVGTGVVIVPIVCEEAMVASA